MFDVLAALRRDRRALVLAGATAATAVALLVIGGTFAYLVLVGVSASGGFAAGIVIAGERYRRRLEDLKGQVAAALVQVRKRDAALKAATAKSAQDAEAIAQLTRQRDMAQDLAEGHLAALNALRAKAVETTGEWERLRPMLPPKAMRDLRVIAGLEER